MFCDIICKVILKKIEIYYDTSKPEGDFDRRPNLTRAEEIIGWKQKIQIDEGLQKTFKCVKSKLDK